MANHLIIGLGGTGGNVIRSLRKKIYQNLQKDDPENVNIRYLYVDTSPESMALDDPTWKILGHSVQLSQNSQLLISGVNLRDIMNQAAAYPGISSWLGNRKDYEEILNSAEGANRGAGQKRRLGRFLFSCKVAEFNERIHSLVYKMTNATNGAPREADVTFHVCCGLAGGTGSGSIVDALVQLRSKFPKTPTASYKIVVYAVLPARYPVPTHKTANYHANGYAALLELNALAVGKWAPHDISGSVTQRLKVQDPFHNCYLFGDENSAGVRIDLAKDGPDIIASFLYQKIVEIETGHVDFPHGNLLAREEGFENPVSGERSSSGELARSLSFFSFGIKQIAYPEVEIREFLTYSFALEATRQLLFNNWADGIGYKEEAIHQPFADWVREKSTQEKWFLTDERITLSEGILPAEINNPRWRGIADFWRTLLPLLSNRVQEDNRSDMRRALPELTRLCDQAYRDEYRGAGVKAFYETKRGGDMREQVLELRAKIEGDLFSDWHNGERALRDVARLADSLVEMIEERVRITDDKISKHSEESQRYRENEEKIANNFKAWAKLNIASIAFGKAKSILSAQAECYITRYTMRTRVEGLRYARELLVGLRQELNGLATEVGACSKTISDASKRVREALGVRCVDSGVADLSGQVVRFYDPNRIHVFTRTLTIDRVEQRRQTALVRDRIVGLLGDRKNFTSFNAKVSEGGLVDLLESVCVQSAMQAHDSHAERFVDQGRVLKVGLVELMRNQFGGNDEGLRKYIHEVMKMAGEYLVFETSEEKRRGAGVQTLEGRSTRRQALLAILPEAPEALEFRNSLQRAIEGATQRDVTSGINKHRMQEVTLISLSSVFPARFVSVVGFLRSEYLKRVSEPGARADAAFVELHLEGTLSKFSVDQSLPELYPESYTSEQFRPWIMIAEAMGLLQPDRDVTTGVQRLYLTTIDSAGFKKLTDVGSSIEDLIDSVDAGNFETIRKEVKTRLEGDYKHSDRRDELLSRIRIPIEQLGELHKPNDPVFQRARKAFSEVQTELAYEGQYAK